MRARPLLRIYLQVLVPTYLKAPPEEYVPYLKSALAPCIPVVLPGVTARDWTGEWKQAEVALMQWWKAGRGCSVCAMCGLCARACR